MIPQIQGHMRSSSNWALGPAGSKVLRGLSSAHEAKTSAPKPREVAVRSGRSRELVMTFSSERG